MTVPNIWTPSSNQRRIDLHNGDINLTPLPHSPNVSCVRPVLDVTLDGIQHLRCRRHVTAVKQLRGNTRKAHAHMRHSYSIGMGRIDPAHLAEWQNVLFAQICINLDATASKQISTTKICVPGNAVSIPSKVWGWCWGGGAGEGGREYW